MGHRVQSVDALTNAYGIAVEYDAKGRPVRFSGGSDPRGEGKAAGY
jgi:gamma-glutamyltranspeptidase